MLITREADYAVRCVLYLAQHSGKRAVVNEIAETMGIPRHYLAKILQKLGRAGIISSIRGIGGGYSLVLPPDQVSLYDIISAVQDTAPVNLCAVDARKCSFIRSCAAHPVWVDIRKDIVRRLRRETISRLIKKSAQPWRRDRRST